MGKNGEENKPLSSVIVPPQSEQQIVHHYTQLPFIKFLISQESAEMSGDGVYTDTT